MFCIECGNRVETGFKFCPNCGTKVSQKGVETNQSSKKVQKRIETQGREYSILSHETYYYDSDRCYPISEFNGKIYYISTFQERFFVMMFCPKTAQKSVVLEIEHPEYMSDYYSYQSLYVNSYGIFIIARKNSGNVIFIDRVNFEQKLLPITNFHNAYYIANSKFYFRNHFYDVRTGETGDIVPVEIRSNGKLFRYSGYSLFANEEYVLYFPTVTETNGRKHVMPMVYSLKKQQIMSLPRFEGYRFAFMDMATNVVWYTETEVGFDSGRLSGLAKSDKFSYYKLVSGKLVKEFGAKQTNKWDVFFNGNIRLAEDVIVLKDGSNGFDLKENGSGIKCQGKQLGDYLACFASMESWHIRAIGKFDILGEIFFKEDAAIFEDSDVFQRTRKFSPELSVNFNVTSTLESGHEEIKLADRTTFSMNYKSYQATGFLSSNGFTVQKGSQINLEIVPSCPQGTRKARQEYADKINGNVLVADIEFSSISAAASFVAGASQNGNVVWKNENGVTFKELHK